MAPHRLYRLIGITVASFWIGVAFSVADDATRLGARSQPPVRYPLFRAETEPDFVDGDRGHSRIKKVQYPFDPTPLQGVTDEEEEEIFREKPEHEEPPKDPSPLDIVKEFEPEYLGVRVKSAKLYSSCLTSPSTDLRWLSIYKTATLEVPAIPGLYIIPSVAAHHLTSASTFGLRRELYDQSFEFSHYAPVGDNWLINTSFAPGLFSDWHNFTRDSIRLPGRVVAAYKLGTDWQLVGGIAYLNRKDVPWLPVLGAIYYPNEDVRCELVFPRPRLGYRYTHDGNKERWVTLRGEFGGGQWGYERTDGVLDTLTYKDWRVLAGFEWKYNSRLGFMLEGGYVFHRALQLGTSPVINLPANGVVQLSLVF